MTTAQPEERAGHHWQEPDRVAEYVSRMDRQEQDRAVIFSLMTELLPGEPGDGMLILDVGSGYAPVAAACLDARPNATAIALDISDAMMDVGRERMARFGDRFSYMVGDFAEGVLPPPAVAAGPFDAVVSARAIHHLPAEGMKSLYASIHASLKPGGAFFNIDTASPETDFLREKFRSVTRSPGDLPRAATTRTPEQLAHDAMLHHRDATLVRHIEWLKAAGFTSVDCFWKRLGQAMVGGFKA